MDSPRRPIGLSHITRPVFIKPKPSRWQRLAQAVGVSACAVVVVLYLETVYTRYQDRARELQTLRSEIEKLRAEVRAKDDALRAVNPLCTIDMPRRRK